MILNIIQQLVDNEFDKLIDVSDVKTGRPDIFCAGKRVGPNLYCVIAIDADKPDYKQKFERMAGYLGGSYSVQDFNLVLLGVFAASEITDELREYTAVDAETFERVNILKWVITPNGVEVFGKQPTRLLNIRTLLENSLGMETSAKSVGDILENSVKKRRESIVSRDTLLTFAMIALIGVIYAAQVIDGGRAMIEDYGMLPFSSGQYYRVFTSMFLHGSVEHLLSNALGLYIFGTRVERYYGKAKFLAVYFIGGILAGLTSSLFLTGYAIGASGAIFALMGAVAAYGFKTKRSADGFDLYFLLIFAFVGFAAGGLSAGIDNTAHIAGFVYGFVIGLVQLSGKRSL